MYRRHGDGPIHTPVDRAERLQTRQDLEVAALLEPRPGHHGLEGQNAAAVGLRAAETAVPRARRLGFLKASRGQLERRRPLVGLEARDAPASCELDHRVERSEDAAPICAQQGGVDHRTVPDGLVPEPGTVLLLGLGLVGLAGHRKR